MGPVLIAGGTGFIGSALCARLEARGATVAALTRDSNRSRGGRRWVTWRPEDPAAAAAVLVPEVEKASVVINLAGEPVAARWSRESKRLILDSRVLSTRALVDAMARAKRRPTLLINASAVGYYGCGLSGPVDERGPAGTDFLAQVCRAWEAEAQRGEALGVKVVLVRIGLVLGRGGGALRRMLPPFKLGLGGPLGDGTQWMSWIHLDDLTGLLDWLIALIERGEPSAIPGVVNATAPLPVTNLEFSRTLAAVLGRPCLFRVPAFLLRLALGEMSSMLLQGQRVLPQAAVQGGFRFRFPQLQDALRDLLAK